MDNGCAIGRVYFVLDRLHHVHGSAVYTHRLCAAVRICLPDRVPHLWAQLGKQSASSTFSHCRKYNAIAFIAFGHFRDDIVAQKKLKWAVRPLPCPLYG